MNKFYDKFELLVNHLPTFEAKLIQFVSSSVKKQPTAIYGQ